MLVLGRKKDEGIRIGPDIEVVIHRISKSRVSLAIRAPKHLKIDRIDTTDTPDADNTVSPKQVG